MLERFSLNQLNGMETISEGHTDDLKYDDGKIRVWVSRLTVSDGMPYDNQVTVERLNEDFTWETVDEYEPLD